jgi:RNA polymerase sigma-70 factor (family 1)
MQEPSNHMKSTDPELMAGFRSGQQDAFTRVYYSLYQRLYWYGRKLVGEEQEVEDMIAEGFIQVWKRKEEFTTLESISMFLHVAVRNQCLNLIKRRQMKNERHAEILAAVQAQLPGDFFIEQVQSELMRQIFAEVDKLPVNLRDVFLLSFQEGLKPAEIAERLQLNVQTVKNRKVSALKILKAAVAHEPLMLALLMVLEYEGRFLA